MLVIEKKPSKAVPQSMNIPYYDFWFSWYEFSLKYGMALYEALAKSLESFLDVQNAPAQKIENSVRASFDTSLRNNLKSNEFSESVGKLVNSFVENSKFGYNQFYNNLSDLNSMFIRFFDPIRETLNRTPSDIIEMEGRFHIHHYKSTLKKKHKTPILVVYSLINRHYILDLLPKISVINVFLKNGFDVFATDWGTPSSYDKDLTLENYSHEYVENAVEKIKEITGSEKVSLFGYCWGGIFALVYSAIHPESVKNLVLHATPLDLGKKDTVIENWTAKIDADKLVDTFGNVPGQLLNLAFILRNPVEAGLKYQRYFSEPHSVDEILQFFAIESWVYDGRPIIGSVYQEVIDQIYKNNLLIKNKMKVGQKDVDLGNITMPVLNIIGLKDDLVPPHSSRTIMDVIPSSEKKLIEFPTGHVGLCISQKAHDNLWTEVVEWLSKTPLK